MCTERAVGCGRPAGRVRMGNMKVDSQQAKRSDLEQYQSTADIATTGSALLLPDTVTAVIINCTAAACRHGRIICAKGILSGVA